MIRKKKKMQMSKIIAWAVFFIIIANMLFVEIMSYIMMWHFADLSALYTMINCAIGSCIAIVADYAIYSIKAYKETYEEERVKFAREKLEKAVG